MCVTCSSCVCLVQKPDVSHLAGGSFCDIFFLGCVRRVAVLAGCKLFFFFFFIMHKDKWLIFLVWRHSQAFHKH